MRTVDLTPLYRSIVGFDRMASLMEQAARQDVSAGWPPYNIEHTGENAYRIELAVAGFAPDDLDIELKEGLLTVTGKKGDVETERKFLHRGIAERGFERRFQLADHVKVLGANLEHGLLVIDLVREIPEALKPRKIAIGGGATTVAIEDRKAA